MNRIFVSYSTNLAKSTYELMAQANIYQELSPEMKVAILPDLTAVKPSWQGVTTHKEIVEGVINYLINSGITDISVVQSPWTGYSSQDAFAAAGYFFLEEKYNVKLIDVDQDDLVFLQHDNLNFRISETVYSSDYIINVPVLKAHAQIGVACCFKNILDCVPSEDKGRFYSTGIERAINALSKVINANLHIVDNICSDYVNEKGGVPLYQNRIYLGKDPLLLSSYGSMLLGFEPWNLREIQLAYINDLGSVYNPDIHPIVELDEKYRPIYTRAVTRHTQELSKYVQAREACTPCFSAVIIGLHRALEEKLISKEELPKLRFQVGKKYRGKTGKDIGIGSCTKLFKTSVSGCPAKAVDIVRFIRDEKK